MAGRKLGAFAIAVSNLSRRKFRTAALILTVAVFAFTIFTGSIFSASLKSGLASLSGRLGADILLVPYGYDRKIEGSILRGEPSTFYMNADLLEKVRSVEGVAEVTPQLYVATLAALCCTYPVQIIGFEPETDFVISPWLANTLKQAPKEGEVIVGDKLVGEVGSMITFFGQDFRVVARLDATGMGFDTSAFMNMQTAEKLLKSSGIAEENMEMNFISSLMIRVTEGYEVKYVANLLLQKYALDYNLDFVMAKNMISDIASRLSGMSKIIYAIAGLLWLVALGVLALVFSVMFNERLREFALLRVIGATKGKLFRIILTESLIISLVGGFIGLLAGSMLIFPFNSYISNTVSLPYMEPEFMTVLKILGASFLLSAVVGPLSSLFSAIKAVKSDVYLGLRSGE